MFKIRRKNRSGIYAYMEYDVLNTVAQNMPNIIRSDAELLSSMF